MGKKRNSDLRSYQQEFMGHMHKQMKYMVTYGGMDEVIVDEVLKGRAGRKRKRTKKRPIS